jgi:hypothetical protein
MLPRLGVCDPWALNLYWEMPKLVRASLYLALRDNYTIFPHELPKEVNHQ